MTALGDYAGAGDLVRRMAPVYARGPGGQSHQMFTANGTAHALPGKAHSDQQVRSDNEMKAPQMSLTGG